MCERRKWRRVKREIWRKGPRCLWVWILLRHGHGLLALDHRAEMAAVVWLGQRAHGGVVSTCEQTSTSASSACLSDAGRCPLLVPPAAWVLQPRHHGHGLDS